MKHKMNKTLCTALALLCCASSAVIPSIRPLCLAGDFERQADELLRYIRPTHEQRQALHIVEADLERVLRPRWPGCRLSRFGSTVTGLALKSSDVDVYVDIPGETREPSAVLAATHDILKNYPELFQKINSISKAHVPLLTCIHVPTNLFLDITFSDPQAINGSLLLAYYMQLDKRVLDLATIIKYWGSVHDIANGKPTLPSYATVLLSLFYLQQKGIVPPVAALQTNVTPHELDHWNTAFEPIEYHTDNNETLYELLGGFFKYYSDFDFENTIISTYIGYSIPRAQFMDLDSLKNFSLYKRNVANGLVTPFRFGYLNIQDTIRHHQNTGKPRNEGWLADRLVTQVRSAASMYEELSSEEFLTGLLVPRRRIEAGVLKTFWSGGIGSPEHCRHQ